MFYYVCLLQECDFSSFLSFLVQPLYAMHCHEGWARRTMNVELWRSVDTCCVLMYISIELCDNKFAVKYNCPFDILINMVADFFLKGETRLWHMENRCILG